jgi:hypothetical protein
VVTTSQRRLYGISLAPQRSAEARQLEAIAGAAALSNIADYRSQNEPTDERNIWG